MKIIIKNCRIISSDLDIENGFIEISDNIISDVSDMGKFNIKEHRDKNIIDGSGKIVFPGFIDIHTHGANNYDVTDKDPEAVREVAKIKLKEGVTTFCPTTLTLPADVLKRSCENIENYKKNTEYAKVAGVHLEGPFISSKMAGAQNPEYILKPNIELVEELNSITKVSIVSYAVELTNELVKIGIVSSCAHSAATYEDFVKARKCGLKHITHFCNQITPLHHREIGLVGAGFMDEIIKLELISDKIHICPDMIRLILKIRGVENIFLITDSIRASWLTDGEYDLGGLSVIVKDQVARIKDTGSIAGSTLKYYNGLKNVYDITGLPLKEIIKCATINQAEALGLTDAGEIKKGYKADIVIANSSFIPEIVFVEGKKFELDK